MCWIFVFLNIFKDCWLCVVECDSKICWTFWIVFNLCLCTCLGNCLSSEWPSVIWCLFSHLWSWPSASFLFNEISFHFCVPVWAGAYDPKLIVFASCLFARVCTCSLHMQIDSIFQKVQKCLNLFKTTRYSNIFEEHSNIQTNIQTTPNIQ